MRFIDSHCHLDFSEFDETRTELIKACKQVGIEHFIVPGVSLAQSTKLFSFAQSEPSISVALGLHPYFLPDHQTHHLAELEQLAKAHLGQFIAIGECGLDRSIDDLNKQTQLFEGQIELANQLALPLIVHHRQSHDLIARSFKRCKPKYGGVIHAFSGSEQQAQSYIKQGFKLGVGGVISYPRAGKTRKVISAIEPQYLVLETDSPSMPLAGFQGLVNTPLKVRDVFTYLCELKGITGDAQEEFAQALYESCSALFRI
ncbi:TatD family hydrolase [Pseudoalteromonas sp. L1]|uniref:TatD family hydrolase n=1 Tax=Pseudoalteromonas sp. L1 TaxID=195716 RepID=UPI001F35CF82|nr:TatD family hydrolase [Pseudoalteromonas sp. L1]